MTPDALARVEGIGLVYILVAFFSWIPYTAVFGNLEPEQARIPARAFLGWQVCWLVGCLLWWALG